MMTKKCTSIAAHFKGLADALVLYDVHCLMQLLWKPLDTAIEWLLSL
jgi:hypothetical protein